MFQIDDLNARWNELIEWRNSDEYRSLCHYQQEECLRLTKIGKRLYPSIFSKMYSIARAEYAVGGEIHRGFYCPSPIYDVIVGNVKRGRVLKRMTAISNITQQFNFDEKDHLQSCISYSNGIKICEEFLFLLEDKRYGITVSESNEIIAICEEVFLEKRIQQYAYIEFISDGEESLCFHLHTESFYYDEVGLKSCKWEEFEPLSNMYRMQHIDFERENDYLSAYSVIERKGLQTECINNIRYIVSKRVRA